MEVASERRVLISQSKEEILANLTQLRAYEIAGVLQYLFEKGKLNKNNLYGKVVDVGTGAGAGIVALKMFGAHEVIGVDHISVHNGVNVQEILGHRFVHKTAASYLRSLPACSVRLITAFNTNISLAEFYPEAARPLVPGGQILVTTNAPESVGYLGSGVWLAEEDWIKLPIGHTPIAEREAFSKGKLSFTLANHCPDRDRFFFIETKRGTK